MQRFGHPDEFARAVAFLAKVGTEFDCTFTAPDGDYVAHLKITKVDGTNVEYDIESKRA